MVLALSQQQLSELSAHAERVYPEECCGLLLGKMSVHDATMISAVDSEREICKSLLELVPLENNWTTENVPASGTSSSTEDGEAVHTKHRRYSINPKDMLRVQKQARSQGLDIIGIYHSHPDHVAVPSECDRSLAWPEYVYTIVSVCNGKAVDVKSWTLDSEHQFQPEAMKVSPSSARDRMPVSA